MRPSILSIRMTLAKFVIVLEADTSSMCIVHRDWINRSKTTYRYPRNMSMDKIYDRAIDDIPPEDSWGTYRIDEILYSADKLGIIKKKLTDFENSSLESDDVQPRPPKRNRKLRTSSFITSSPYKTSHPFNTRSPYKTSHRMLPTTASKKSANTFFNQVDPLYKSSESDVDDPPSITVSERRSVNDSYQTPTTDVTSHKEIEKAVNEILSEKSLDNTNQKEDGLVNESSYLGAIEGTRHSKEATDQILSKKQLRNANKCKKHLRNPALTMEEKILKTIRAEHARTNKYINNLNRTLTLLRNDLQQSTDVLATVDEDFQASFPIYDAEELKKLEEELLVNRDAERKFNSFLSCLALQLNRDQKVAVNEVSKFRRLLGSVFDKNITITHGWSCVGPDKAPMKDLQCTKIICNFAIKQWFLSSPNVPKALFREWVKTRNQVRTRYSKTKSTTQQSVEADMESGRTNTHQSSIEVGDVEMSQPHSVEAGDNEVSQDDNVNETSASVHRRTLGYNEY